MGGAAYLNTGTTAGTVAAGNHTHSGYQPAGNYQPAGDYQTAGNYLTSTTIQTSAVSVTSNITNQSNPFSLSDGQQGTVVYYNNSAQHTVAMSSSGVKWPDNSAPTLTIPANGYAEVNYFKVGGTVYARGV